MVKLNIENNVVVGGRVDGMLAYLVSSNIKVYRDRSGVDRKMLRLVFRDGSGKQINGVQWNCEEEFASGVYQLEGVVTSYNGETQITVDSLTLSDDASLSDFIDKSRVDESRTLFRSAVKDLMDARSKEIVTMLINKIGVHRFYESWAGKSIHDAFAGGLVRHTAKMLRLASTLVEYEQRIGVEEAQLLYLGVVLHDIGKVVEVENGVYSEDTVVGHIVIGLEMLFEIKETVIKHFGIRGYKLLQSMLDGHHGEFGARPTSVLAYTLHLIDMLDSKVCGMLDAAEAKGLELGSLSSVYFDSYRLSL